MTSQTPYGAMQPPPSSAFTRRNFLMASAAVAGVAALASCSSSEPGSSKPGTGSPQRGGTLTIGISQNIEDVNYYTGIFNDWSQLVAPAMYEPLVKIGAQGKTVPVLAESWSHSPDYRTWTFKIRQGVKFHTGADMTVRDVVYSLSEINDATEPVAQAVPLPATAWGGVSSPDANTVVVKLKTPLALDQLIQNWCILPEGSRALGAKLQSESVGTGPFVLQNFVRGNSIELARNSQYWNDPRPYLDELKFVFLTSVAARLSNFSSGTVNMLHSVGVVDLDSVAKLPDAKLVRSGTLWHHWAPLMRSGALSTTAARLALRYAFDVEKLNEVAWQGHGVAFGNPFELTPYFAADVETWPAAYDITKARSLLSAAGVAGETVNLYVLSGSTNSELEAQILVEDFGRAGLKSQIVPQDSATWTNGYYTEQSNQGLTNNFLPLYFPWRGNAQQMLQPQALPAPPQWPSSTVPEVFEAYEESQSAYTDAQLQTALTTLQQRIGEYAPAFPTWAGPLNEVVPNNLDGLETTDFGVVRFADAYFA